MTRKLTEEEKEYLYKVCKENRFTLKIKQVKVNGASKINIKNYVANLEELIKWRAKYGITQAELATLGLLGMNLRRYQDLEEGNELSLGYSIIKKIRMNNLIDLKFVEENENEEK